MPNSKSVARDRERRAREDAIVADFNGDANAMAVAVVECGAALVWLEGAIGVAKAGAPFSLIAPGPHWKPGRAPSVVEDSAQEV